MHDLAVIETFPRERSPADAIFTADALDGQAVPPRPWHVPGMVPGATVTLVSGDGGVGKSILALQLCVATQLGTQWIGQQPRQGRAFYLSAEDDRGELHRRLAALATFYGRPLSDLSGLKCWPVADVIDIALAQRCRDDTVEATALWETLADQVREWRPALVILDSVADLYAGDENNRGQVRKFIGMCRNLAIETGAAIVLLSHPSKSSMNDGSGFSGSTAWNNSVRSRLYLKRPGDSRDDAPATDPLARTLSVMKANYAQAGGDLCLSLQGGGFACEDVPARGGFDLAIARDRVDDLFLTLLATYAAQRRPVSDKAGSNYAPKLFAQDPRAAGTTKQGFTQAMNRLFAADRLEIEIVGSPSRPLRSILVCAEKEG